MSTRLHIVVSDKLLARVDAAIGARPGPVVSRSEWVRWAVERALGDTGPDPQGDFLPAPVERPRPAVRSHAPNCKCPVCV